MKNPTITLVILGIALGCWWTWERTESQRLERALKSARENATKLAVLHAERSRLRGQLGDPDELSRLHNEIVRRQTETDETAAPSQQLHNAPWQLGEWMSPADWRNRGQDSPEHTLETMLWAASGGELKILGETLAFGEKSRGLGEEMLRRQTETVRANYDVNGLLALLAAKEIPDTRLQLFARTRHDDDTFTESLYYQQPDGRNSFVHLTFHHEDGAWKLQVPDQAVQSIANELAGIPEPTPTPRVRPERPPPQAAEPRS